MSGPSITSANVSFTLTIPGYFSSGVLLQDWAVDDMFDGDPQELTEDRVGADGGSAIGYIFQRGKMRLMFQANSSSIPVFFTWKSGQDSIGDVITGSAKIVSPALGLDVDLSTVSIKSMPVMPPHKRVAESFTVEIGFDPQWQTTSTN